MPTAAAVATAVAAATAQRKLAEQYVARQRALQAHMKMVITKQVWPRFDATAIEDSLPGLTDSVTRLVASYGAGAHVLAERYYKRARADAGHTGPVTVALPDIAGRDQIAQSMGWATHSLYGAVTPDSDDAALSNVLGVASRAVNQAGADTITQTSLDDPRARGWSREVESDDPCGFCMLLALNDGHYVSEDSAGFEAHDHCQCQAVAVFDGQDAQPSPLLQQAQDLYDSQSWDARAFSKAWRDRQNPTDPGDDDAE